MWYIIILFTTSAFFILGMTGCFTKNQKRISIYNDSTATSTFDTIKGPVSKSVIQARLIDLSQSDAPNKLNPGAMCYEIAVAPSRLEYVCPKCGEKTLYTTDHAYKISEIEKCRNAVNNIYDFEISFDESQFCSKCSPGIKDPELCIDIKYTGESSTHKVCGITTNDIILIKEFLSGSKVHKHFNESETPLKDNLDRLQLLFDVSIKQ